MSESKEVCCEYKNIIRDYFYDFKKNINGQPNEGVFSGILLAEMLMFMKENTIWEGIFIFPIWLSFLSSMYHGLALPFLLYLSPYSAKEREAYIQKILYVKVAVPVLFGCLWDLVLSFFMKLSVYEVLWQLFSMAMIALFFGMMKDTLPTKKGNRVRVIREVYGGLGEYVAAIGLLLFIVTAVFLPACMGEVDGKVFAIILSVLLVLVLPILIPLLRKWKEIKSRFADYELAVRVEKPFVRAWEVPDEDYFE